MIFVCGCAVTGYFLGLQIASLVNDGGTLVGSTIGIIGAAVVSGVGVALIRTLGKQSAVQDTQLRRHVQEIERLGGELDRERSRCEKLENDNERLRAQLLAARSE